MVKKSVSGRIVTAFQNSNFKNKNTQENRFFLVLMGDENKAY